MTENQVEPTPEEVKAPAPVVAIAEALDEAVSEQPKTPKGKVVGKIAGDKVSTGPAFDPLKRRKRTTEYGTQLAEKQAAKKIFGVRERQFRNYYKKALRLKGDTGEIMRQLLQMRLDNVIYQAGFAKTLRAARQMVSHNYFLVNGKKVNIPSYQAEPKDMISIKPEKQGKKIWDDEEFKDIMAKKEIPSWLAVDRKEKTIKVAAQPTGNDLEQSFNARLIVEFYSR